MPIKVGTTCTSVYFLKLNIETIVIHHSQNWNDTKKPREFNVSSKVVKTKPHPHIRAVIGPFSSTNT